MGAPMQALSGGDGSALPGRRKRAKKKHHAEKRNQDRAVMLVVQPDGSFRAANQTGREWLRGQGFKVGDRIVSYLYVVADPRQFRKAHLFAKRLREASHDFDGMTDHEVIKHLQVEHGIACVRAKVILPKAAQELLGSRHMNVMTPKSIAPGFMDGSEFEKVWRALANAVAQKYFGVLDADAVEKLLDLMPEPA